MIIEKQIVEYKLKNFRKQRSQEDILYYSAKARATKKNLPFDILPKDIFVPFHCPVLGIPLLREGPLSDFSPSLDRIIPYKGYVKGNIIVVSAKANRIKNDSTIEELEKVYEFYKKLLKYEKKT